MQNVILYRPLLDSYYYPSQARNREPAASQRTDEDHCSQQNYHIYQHCQYLKWKISRYFTDLSIKLLMVYLFALQMGQMQGGLKCLL